MSSLSGNGNKLVGNDGTVYGAVVGAEVTGDASTPMPVGKAIITAVAGSSGFPGNSGATGAIDLPAGYMLEVRTGDTITPAVGDKFVPLTLVQLCDLRGWSLDFSAGEIDISTFCNDENRYDVGRIDVSGQAEGIVTLGKTDSVESYGLMRRFMDIVQQIGVASIDLFEKLNTEIYAELVSNKRDEKGDWLSYFAPINLFGFSLGASIGNDAQTFQSPIRIATGIVGAAEVEVKPALYRFARGA